jgi:hypothetical protein
MDEKVLIDLQDAADGAKAIGDLLNRLYYHSDFSTVFNRPVLSMMIAGAKYLSSNLLILKDKYAGGAHI